MKLRRVSVRKYRSIGRAADFAVDDFAVLIGPNNQGKSNLLRATVLAMNAIEAWSTLPPAIVGPRIPTRILLPDFSHVPQDRRFGSPTYDWEEDFPLFARGRPGGQTSTVILLEFELDESEQAAFKAATGISTNQRLPVRVQFGERFTTLTISKQGKGEYGKKAQEIANFVTERIMLLYIPAVRTSETAKNIAEEILSSRRRRMLNSPKYAKLMSQIEDLDREAITDVENLIKATLERFIPVAESVSLRVNNIAQETRLNDILIDDGVKTPISAKGDGIQSLVALALTLEWTRAKGHPDRKLIVAVEEPESHLHPGAVHELRSVLQGIAETQQVIVTTHSQALVNRSAIFQNVIVSDRSARPASSLDDLRNALGVRLSDALSSAEVIVVCEGWIDDQILLPLLSRREDSVKKWVEDGRVLFESAGSGSKIYSRVLAARNILTRPVVVIDGDEAGLKDVKRLTEDGVIDPTCVIQIRREGMKYAELEDIFEMETYIEAVEKTVGFEFKPTQRNSLDKGRSGAWSERLESILYNAGFPDEKIIVRRAKQAVCLALVAAIDRGDNVVRPEYEDLVDRLIEVIRRQLDRS